MPDVIKAEIRQLTPVAPSERPRYKFLSHLSASEDIFFVEVNMRGFLQQDAYDAFIKDIQRFYFKKKQEKSEKNCF